MIVITWNVNNNEVILLYVNKQRHRSKKRLCCGDIVQSVSKKVFGASHQSHTGSLSDFNESLPAGFLGLPDSVNKG